MIRLTLGSDLTYQNVAAFNESTNTNDPHFIKIAKAFLSNVGNLTGDFLRTQLGLTGFNLVFLDMNRGVEIIGNQTLADEQGILVVVSLPGHVGDQNVLSQRNFPAFTSGTIRQNLSDNDRITVANDWTLVQASVLVGTLILLQKVRVLFAVFIQHNDGVGIHENNGSIHS